MIDFSKPHIVVIKDTDNGLNRYYQANSPEEVNRISLKFINQEMQEYGCYKRVIDIYRQRAETNEIPDNIKLTEEEVAALPEHLRKDVEAEREQYFKQEKVEQGYLKWSELVEAAITANDDRNAWRLVQWAQQNGIHAGCYQVSIEELRVVDED